ncbi:MAG: type II secretion system protein GspC [Synergistota bacterium]|nr:type II secretion system protein GspC [Synergistota bacterium]
MSFFGKTGLLTSSLSFFGRVLPIIGMLLTGIALSSLIGMEVERRMAPLLVQARASRAILDGGTIGPEEGGGVEMARELRSLVDVSPFGVPARPEIAVAATSRDLPPEEERVFSVDGIKVIGSLPDVAAWLDREKKVSLVLKGQAYGGFLLKEVYPYSVVLAKDNVNYEVYISYKDEGKSARSESRVEAPPAKEPVFSDSGSQVQTATDDSEGVVARELVDSLLMNPFNELKRVRLIPKFVDGKPTGIEVANIMDGSVLKELGVQKGDVVKSVNGVVIRNMGDVANAINSLMGGSRFEVAVGRGDEEIMLNYVVR